MKVLLGLLVCSVFLFVLVQSAPKHLICYFASWTYYRPGHGKFNISDIDVTLCTHIYFAFVGLGYDGGLYIIDPWFSNDDGLKGFRQFMALRQRKPSLKLLISMGGWNEGSEKYSKVAADPDLRENMVDSVMEFISEWGFDGFDFDWEYPGNREGSNATIDKDNLSLLLEDLSRPLKQAGKILSMAVSGAPDKIAVGYDVPKVSELLDIINIMAYDYHGAFDNFVGHVSPLYPSSLDNPGNASYTVSSGVEFWIEQGAHPSKICMGIPSYGRSFTLADETQTGLYAPITGGGIAGPYSQTEGFLDYKEICELHSDWEYVWDDEQKVPHRFSGDQWVGFDDERSVKLKVEYAKSKKLGGIMFWSFDSDDFNGLCGNGKYPLLTTINRNLY